MNVSIIDLQRKLLLDAIYSSRRRDPRTGQYIRDENLNRIVVVDEYSAKILANVTKKDEIMKEDDILNVMMLYDKERRDYTTEDAVYILSPQPHVIEYLKDDLNQQRHQHAFLLWTSQPTNDLCKSLHNARSGPQVLQNARTLWVDFFPAEPLLVTFREPDSFQICFNKSCESLVMRHVSMLAQKIVSVCVTLGENPRVRYYEPQEPIHRAAILCRMLADKVQASLDFIQSNTRDFPQQPPKQRATLVITDRSMDPIAPLVHETTYQAMTVDTMPEDEVFYAMSKTDVRVIFDEPVKERLSVQPEEAENQQKEAQKGRKLDEEDETWVTYRHTQMGDVLNLLPTQFKKFRNQYAEFEQNGNESVRTLQSQVANLHEYMRKKATFEMHINMAERCSAIFFDLLPLIKAEQLIATGLDENGGAAKHVADQLVQLLDVAEGGTSEESRLRLLIAYIIFRDGILRGDMEKLRSHASLVSEQDRQKIYNLYFLGVRVERELTKQNQNVSSQGQSARGKRRQVFKPENPPVPEGEQGHFVRSQPQLKYLLEAVANNELDKTIFPPTKLDPEDDNVLPGVSQSSLRTGNKPNPNWARGPTTRKPRQRIIVFMAGGSTYSEARACYEVTQQKGSDKEVFLMTTEMIRPVTYLEQVGKLHLRSDQVLSPPPPNRAFQPLSPGNQGPPQPTRQQQPAPGLQRAGQPPVEAMGKMRLGPPTQSNGPRPSSSQTPTPPSTAGSFNVRPSAGAAAPPEEKEKEKKRRMFGLGRKH